jgi:hypothetical protein
VPACVVCLGPLKHNNVSGFCVKCKDTPERRDYLNARRSQFPSHAIEKRRAAQDANRERIREQNRASYRRHRDVRLVESRVRNLSKYGLTLESFDSLLRAQGGLCAICSTKPDGTLCVDHCHQTGSIRGLLCSPCNRAIGHLGDSPEGLTRALSYLEKAAISV